MHTITSLRKLLNLSTTNQVRNRIDAVKDVLRDHLKRGPNNQILVTDEGVDLLRRLQELYDSGLTMTEASDVMRATSHKTGIGDVGVSSRFVRSDTKPHDTDSVVAALREEIAFLRGRIVFLESQLRTVGEPATAEGSAWWQTLREDVDGA